MNPANNKIIVSVDFDQKKKISIEGNDFLLAKQYNHNRRESMPVLCKVENGNGHIAEGTFLLVHHNRFTESSPHRLSENIFSLAYNSSIFASVDNNGNAHSLCGNIIVNYIFKDYPIPVPDHLKKPNPFKYVVVEDTEGYRKGDFVFAYEFSNYEMVYVFNGQERRAIKLVKSDIVGKIVKQT